MNQPLVSVIVPTYNGEKHLAVTLEAIINQDYENIEIIFVNDASTDNTLKIAEDILKNSGRVYKIINHEKNSGVSVSRNDGLDAARGEYIWFCDSDDLAEKIFVSSLVREAEDKNADFVFCGLKIYFKNENRFEAAGCIPEKPLGNSENYLRAWAKREIDFWSVCNCLFKKEFLKTNKLKFSEKLYVYEDGEFILKALALSSKISIIKEMLYIYIRHSELKATKIQEVLALAESFIPAKWRAGRCILKNTKDQYVKNYVFAYLIANGFIKLLTIYAKSGDEYKEKYYAKLKILRHKKIRKLMFSTIKFFFKDL